MAFVLIIIIDKNLVLALLDFWYKHLALLFIDCTVKKGNPDPDYCVIQFTVSDAVGSLVKALRVFFVSWNACMFIDKKSN